MKSFHDDGARMIGKQKAHVVCDEKSASLFSLMMMMMMMMILAGRWLPSL
jgi:hypothetical protein